MKKALLNSLLAVSLTLLAPEAQAAGCTPIRQAKTYQVQKFTNYAPLKAPGSMNGRCGTSASGYDACKFLLEDYLEGKAPAVMGAVPQTGPNSDLFGGIYQAAALENGLGTGKCIKVFAGDRYAKRIQGQKMDIVTREIRSGITRKVNLARGDLKPLGRAPKMQYPKRKITPNVKAMAPLNLGVALK